MQGQIGDWWNPMDWLSDIVQPLVDFFTDAFSEYIVTPIVSFITFFVAKILYMIQLGLFYVIDLVQMVIRKIVGLPAYTLDGEYTYSYYNGSERVYDDDLVVSFIQSETLRSVFISILVAAVILLFIATFIAVLKSELDSKSNAKGPIFANALKSLVYFAMVPVVSFMGIYVANIVLRTLDSATSQSAQAISTQIFSSAGYSANRARSSSKFAVALWNNGNSFLKEINSLSPSDSNFQEKVAVAIDNAFRANSTLADALRLDADIHGNIITDEEENSESENGTNSARGPPSNVVVSEAEPMFAISQNEVKLAEGSTPVGTISIKYGYTTKTVSFASFDCKNFELCYFFYEMIAYNYFIGYVASIVIFGILCNLLIGVIRRLFELAILFVLSPAVVSLMPLDGGERFKAWKDAFLKRVFSAYGPILGLNLVFMVLTLLQGIQLFDPTEALGGFYNALMQCLFIITGLVSIRGLTDMVTQLVGQGDALKEGEETGKEVKKRAAQTAGLAVMGAGVAFSTAKALPGAAKRLGARAGNAGSYVNSMRRAARDQRAFDAAGGDRALNRQIAADQADVRNNFRTYLGSHYATSADATRAALNAQRASRSGETVGSLLAAGRTDEARDLAAYNAFQANLKSASEGTYSNAARNMTHLKDSVTNNQGRAAMARRAVREGGPLVGDFDAAGNYDPNNTLVRKGRRTAGEVARATADATLESLPGARQAVGAAQAAGGWVSRSAHRVGAAAAGTRVGRAVTGVANTVGDVAHTVSGAYHTHAEPVLHDLKEISVETAKLTAKEGVNLFDQSKDLRKNAAGAAGVNEWAKQFLDDSGLDDRGGRTEKALTKMFGAKSTKTKGIEQSENQARSFKSVFNEVNKKTGVQEGIAVRDLEVKGAKVDVSSENTQQNIQHATQTVNSSNTTNTGTQKVKFADRSIQVKLDAQSQSMFNNIASKLDKLAQEATDIKKKIK